MHQSTPIAANCKLATISIQLSLVSASPKASLGEGLGLVWAMLKESLEMNCIQKEITDQLSAQNEEQKRDLAQFDNEFAFHEFTSIELDVLRDYSRHAHRLLKDHGIED